MTSKEKIYRILYLGLLEIRSDSNISGDKKTFEISNLLHNLPLKLQNEDLDYDEIIENLSKSSEHNKGLLNWLKSNL
ncbi:hypothetical protein LNI90_05020 [Tenacibaculum dicentrarchi]|nr:hypothetical protein [Tenacibaculum dicentrarchi]